MRWSELMMEKKIGQIIVITRNATTVMFDGPRKYVARGKAANVGKLCNTSKKGKAITARLP